MEINITFFIVNKRLREAKVTFLIEHGKKNSNSALYKHTLLKKLPIRTFLMHPMNLDSYITAFIYQTKQKVHPLGFIPFPKAIT